jgi:RNA polymerase sigma-70 factor, ECF subfamily
MVYINRENKSIGMPLSEEDKLMMEIASGNMNAFESLVESYQNQAVRFCYGQLNDYHLAEDVSQEAFLRLYKSAQRYQPQNNFKAFFYKIMINLCRNAFKKQASKPISLNQLGFDIPNHKPIGSCSSQTMEFEESQQLARLVIDKLPKKYREVITLRELEELSYTEIAQMLQVSINQVKILLYRGRQQLNTILNVKRGD